MVEPSGEVTVRGVPTGGAGVIGGSLSEPYTSVTALQDVCMSGTCSHILKI